MTPIPFTTTLLATTQILLMGAVGYVLIRIRFLDEKGLDLLTKLLITIFLPSMGFYYMTKNFSFEAYPHWWMLPLIALGIPAVGFILSQAYLFFKKEIPFKSHFTALVSFPNAGYIPLLLVNTLFPEDVAQKLFVAIFIFFIGFDLSLWTLGVWLVNREKKAAFDWNNLLNPPLLTIITALFVIYFHGHEFIPQTILKPMKAIGDCSLPIAMLVVGGNLAKTRISSFPVGEMTVYLLMKLIMIPLIGLLVLMQWKLSFILSFVLLIETAVPSAVSLSVMARYYKVNGEFINQATLISHVLSVLTIPMFVYAWSLLYGGRM